ncbi:hypothetical protein GCM10008171_08030 [Methylopila jiangsuensis]|uniref:Uncharacterized protein n=1 Tax=Methylopila jiangsuensis TaxID=586230 RepID=A0A9W6N241_9HYPH|nr:hypothetical protein [Methylopila jiangsuensis]MDR6285791.1 hypothetical protein [Methylopila jiangsuensis]GLK75549.1 hypothetical protein GCM10008171_08030 [Methylopila jiangsuensis]
MLGRILKTAANEVLRRRAARTGSGPRRLPPTSAREAQNRAIRRLVRMALDRFMRR